MHQTNSNTFSWLKLLLTMYMSKTHTDLFDVWHLFNNFFSHKVTASFLWRQSYFLLIPGCLTCCSHAAIANSHLLILTALYSYTVKCKINCARLFMSVHYHAILHWSNKKGDIVNKIFMRYIVVYLRLWWISTLSNLLAVDPTKILMYSIVLLALVTTFSSIATLDKYRI